MRAVALPVSCAALTTVGPYRLYLRLSRAYRYHRVGAVNCATDEWEAEAGRIQEWAEKLKAEG